MIPPCSTYICSDDGWSAGRNATTGEMLADPVKFPGGWAALASYIHSKGLKVGLYSAASSVVCSGRVGSLYNEYLDAKTFASWDIDYVKFECVFYLRARLLLSARAPAPAPSLAPPCTARARAPHTTAPAAATAASTAWAMRASTSLWTA